MTIEQTIRNALEALNASGFPAGGDVYEDLAGALSYMEMKWPEVLAEDLE